MPGEVLMIRHHEEGPGCMPESSRRDSNPQPDDYRSPALPIVRPEHIVWYDYKKAPDQIRTGIDPLPRGYVLLLSPREHQYRRQESNLHHRIRNPEPCPLDDTDIEPLAGFEPAPTGYGPVMLPLHHRGMRADPTGLEPATPWLTARRSAN